MAVKYTNNASSTLASGITDTATSLTVATGEGAEFPPLASGDYFFGTLVGTSTTEIVKVTARSSDTMTIVRGQDNTTAAAWDAGTKFELRVCAALIDAVNPDVNLDGGHPTTNYTGSLNIDAGGV